MKGDQGIYLPISELADGELQRKLDYELKKLFENIHDEKMNPTTVRTLTIKIKFKPDQDRTKVDIEGDIATSLANVMGISTKASTGRNMNTGQIEAHELKSGIPGQTYFDNDMQQRTDAGEPTGKRLVNIFDINRDSKE